LHDGAQFRRIGAACKQAESGGALVCNLLKVRTQALDLK
jgi:hypothetical protein